MRNFTISFFLLMIFGCSSIRSQFDELHLVYASGQTRSATMPNGFKVTPEEIISLIPTMKAGFKIYADQEAYYLREEVDTIGITTISRTTDSEHAKKYGLRVLGTTRDEYEFLTITKRQLTSQFYSLNYLSEQLLKRNN